MNKAWWAGVGVAVLVAAGCSPSKQDVATVNGHDITQDALTARMIQTPEAKATLQKVILEQIILDAAAKKNIKITDDDVTQFLQVLKAQYPPGRFEEMNAAAGRTDAIMREDARTQLAVQALMMNGVKVSDESIQKRYKENPNNMFTKPEWKQIGFIVTKDKADAEKAVAALKKSGNFDVVFDQFTIPAAKENLKGFQWYGVLNGTVVNEQRQPLESMQGVLGAPAVRKAIPQTKQGAVSAPISLPAPAGGAEQPERILLYVKSDVPGGKIPLEDLKTAIAYDIARENNQTKQDVLEQIVKDAKVDVKMEQFKDLEKPEVLLPSLGAPNAPGAPAPAPAPAPAG
jgi:foldase protein PrsA